MALQIIENKILSIRNTMVMLDFDLAKLYQVETRVLKQSVRRNLERFPEDFMFQLTKEEWLEVITNCDNLRSTNKFSPSKPYAFTEQGVSMLSSILKSKLAIQINISIMRAFVVCRQYALKNKDLAKKIEMLEQKFDKKFQDIHDVIGYLLQKDGAQKEKKTDAAIGYRY